MTGSPDRWHRWLLDVRFGGDTAPREAELTAHLRPLAESGTGRERRALAYLTAIRG